MKFSGDAPCDRELLAYPHRPDRRPRHGSRLARRPSEPASPLSPDVRAVKHGQPQPWIKKLIPSSGGSKLPLSTEKMAPAEGSRGANREGTDMGNLSRRSVRRSS